MRPLIKLGATVAAAFAGYEGYLWWRKKHSFTPLVAGHGYTVVLDYTGTGLGGPLTTDEIQTYLDEGPAGVGMLRVSAASTDPAKKTITYLVGAMASMQGTQAVLAPATFPSAYGKLCVVLVQDTGNVPVPSST